jgi:ribonuclease HII
MKLNTAARTRRIVKFDNKLRKNLQCILCGVDEAGRGPLAGPVVAAAVIFPDDVFIEGVFDSKQVMPDKREELFDVIIDSALSFGVGIVDNKEIDNVNILQATLLAMNQAISKLKVMPELIVVDGNFYKHQSYEIMNVVKGDEKSFSVAAASIIAKVTRDRIMKDFETQYPNFAFSSHKGYCTRRHMDEILEYGYTDIHRRSFRLKLMEEEEIL